MTAPDQASPAGQEVPPTCYRHPDRETWVSCVRCGRHACPDCLRQAAVGQQCVECIRGAGRGTRQARTAFGGRPVATAAVTWTLVGINEDGLPESEDYNFGTADFQSGSLRLSQDGQWEMKIFYDHVEQNQSLQLDDYGQYGRDNQDLSFASEAYGDHIEGGLDDGFVYMIYDFDGDGEYETEFTFER